MSEPHSLYVHIPFCRNLCDYCDFPKLQYFRIFAEKYLTALEKELASFSIESPLKTIYVGGGTPTALDDDLFERLLVILHPYAKGILEYTFEANPESLTTEKLCLMKRYGVNRLSIGVETTDDTILSSINRHHTMKDVERAVSDARKAEFDNISTDLILGLPGTDVKTLGKDLDNILRLKTDHVSCYSLTVHPNTVFFQKGIVPKPSDEERKMYDLAEKKLLSAGFVHYEVSNWARPGKESLHNLTYWKDERYYGAGLGAAGYVGETRYVNTKSITAYLNGKTRAEEEKVTLSDDRTYFLMLGLRTNPGLDLAEYKRRFGEDFYINNKDLTDRFIDRGLLSFSDDHSRLSATYEGMMILDTMILEYIS